MASDTHDFTHTITTSTSSFQKTVCLQSWWLVKAEKNSQGRRLSVAGFTSREQQAVRLFSSAPILKRYDVFTLETVDGICVTIKGFIDKARTEANGFPSEVFEHFVFGFPPYWEEYAEKCLGEESTIELLARTDPGPAKASIRSETLAHVEESSHCSGRVLRSSSKLEAVKKNDQVSAKILEKEKGVSLSVSMGVSDKEEHAIASVDSVSVDTSSLDLSNSGNRSLRNEITPRKPDTRPSTCNLEQNARFSYKGKISKQDQNCGEIMTEPSVQKCMNKAANASRNSTSVKNKEKIAIGSKESVSENAHASGREAKRKLAYEIPVSGSANERVPTASPESVTCKRSRSGRLLLPALEFWRNQIAVYDADRKITGVTAGLHLELPSKGSKSEPPRKKMQHK